MNNMVSVLGIEFEKNERSNFGSNFESIYNVVYDDDESFFAESKETFDSEDEGLPFKYKLCIEGNCVYDNGNYQWLYALYIVPTAESLNNDKLENVKSFCGVDEPDAYDICSYGCCVLLGSESTDGEEIDMETIYNIAHVSIVINRMRGFYLDRAMNMIGTTGWDLLEDFINGKNFIKASIERNKAE